MRPNAEDNAESGSGRIIYLGDVRRRRAVRKRQAPDRDYLVVVATVAVAAWAVWLAVLFALPPARLLTYVAFFLPLAVAVAATTSVADYVLEWRLARRPTLGATIRHGIMATLVVVINLAALAAHHGSAGLLLGAVVVAVAVETVIVRRGNSLI